MSKRVGLFLMSARGLAVLEAILEAHGPDAIAYVVTAADPSIANDYKAELDARARGAKLLLFDRKSAPATLPPSSARFAAAWRWLLPVQPTSPLVVFHDSLLPRYRGFAPVINALVNGETTLGVTALLAAETYDSGPILGQEAVAIQYPLRIGAAIDILRPCYGRLAVSVLNLLRQETWAPQPQDENQASFSLWRDETDYTIDWAWDAARIRRHVDATGDPYLGASTFVEGRKFRVLSATERPEVTIENRTPGKIIFLEGGIPTVVCGRGLLRIEELVDAETGQSALPWTRFRTRFGPAPR